jgi:hypothetical protein
MQKTGFSSALNLLQKYIGKQFFNKNVHSDQFLTT